LFNRRNEERAMPGRDPPGRDPRGRRAPNDRDNWDDAREARRADYREPGARADYRTEQGLTREDRDAIDGPYTDYGRAFGGYGAGGGYTPNPEEGTGREQRSWSGRDDPGAWFGGPHAEKAHPFGPHRGRGPKGYTRSGERIREDVSDRLMEDSHLDPSDIEVSVTGTEVTLDGTVDSRGAKRRAEDHAEDVTGVTHVQNNLRVRPAPGTVAAQTDPRIAALTDGRDADQQPLRLRD
jgi:hypothetical protein